MQKERVSLGCWVRTLRHVPPRNLAYKLWRVVKWKYYASPFYNIWGGFIRKAAVVEGLVLPDMPLLWLGNKARGEELAGGKWVFLNQSQPLKTSVDWAPERMTVLWQFNLHYHDWLGDLRAAGQREMAQKLVLDWMQQCGHFHKVGWHPYPLSLRVVNWLTHGRWLMAGWDEGTQQAFREVLVAQVGFLAKNLEWDLGYNHYMKNLKALVMAGAGLLECEKLFVPHLARLLRELEVQVLPDGAQAERSPSYHRQVLQDLIDVAAVLRTRGGVPVRLAETLEKMSGVLQFYRHPDGRLALFNDGEAEEAEALEHVVRHGLAGGVPVVLPQAGFVRLGRGKSVLLADVGRIGPDANPGHAHAEVLSFEFSDGTERVFVNGGTFGYQHAKRNVYRGTMMHNTVSVDGEDCAEVWGAFRVGRRPKMVAFEAEGLERIGEDAVLVAEHTGWKHKGILHQRKWVLAADGLRLRGQDVLSQRGKGPHRVMALFMVHPKVKVSLLDDKAAELTTAGGKVWRFEIREGRLDTREVPYAEAFGVAEMTRQLIVHGRISGGRSLTLDWRMQRKDSAGDDSE